MARKTLGVPGPLLLDYDEGMKLPTIAHLKWLAARAGVKIVKNGFKISPSGKGYHCFVIVDPAPRTCMEVVALQAVFGSDPKREACNVNRARMVDTKQVTPYWAQRWNVLYGKD